MLHDAVEREVYIAAAPETVFTFFTDPDKLMRWMGREVMVEPRPGGVLRLILDDDHTMSGAFLVVEPPYRLVFSWGWERGATPPPGSSTVEVLLSAETGGTRLRLIHRGLSEEEQRAHLEGWGYALPLLIEAAEGTPATAAGAVNQT